MKKVTQEELKLILEEGEGYLVEFKEKLSRIDDEIVAFANGAGGRLLLGVRDDGTVKGISITNKLKSQVQDIVNNCEPQIRIDLQELDSILIIHVWPGGEKPYHCSSGFYLRVGPNTQKMKRQQIIEMFQAEGKIRFEELVDSKFDYPEDLSSDKLNHFLQASGISQSLPERDILRNLGAAEKQGGKTIVNNAGILLFAKDLSRHYFHTPVTCALYQGKVKVNVLDRKDFNDDLVSNIDNAMTFLKRHISVRYEFDGSPKRIEIPQLPFEALREAVINAVVHRDYFQKGANVMVEIFEDRVDITSPGGLMSGLKESDFGTISVLRNPLVASLFHRLGYIEKMGTGIYRMQNLMKEAGCPSIQFKFSSFVTVTFPFPVVENSSDRMSEKASEKMSEKTSEKVLFLVKQEPDITISELAQRLDISTRSVERNLSILQKNKNIRRVGGRKEGHWEILK